MKLELLAWVSLALVAAGVGALSFALVVARAPAASRLGKRGMRRVSLAVEHPFIAAVEPFLRLLAAVFRRLPLGAARANLEHKLIRAGEPYGFGADEVLASSVVTGVLAGVGAHLWTKANGWPVWVTVLAAAFGCAIPILRLDELAKLRTRDVSRALPDAMDLFAMCMAAGLDFTGALRRYLELGARKKDALREELWLVANDIDLGHTRRQALQAFALRMPAPLVRELVSAIVQAEEKGTPLAEVLRVQAQLLRMRRSILAEEAVKRAAVTVTGPTMALVMVSIGMLMATVIMLLKQMGF